MRKHDKIVGTILQKLEAERRLLGMPYLTWWFEYHRLEMFQPIESTFPRWMWSDVEGFLTNGDAELMTAMNDYNDVVARLQKTCSDLQHRLERSHSLHELYTASRATDQFRSLGMSQEEIFGARWPDNVFAYLAQLIVNRTPVDCSPIYTIRPYWQIFGNRFLALRSTDEFRELSDHLDLVADETAAAIERLRTRLMESNDVHHTGHAG